MTDEIKMPDALYVRMALIQPPDHYEPDAYLDEYPDADVNLTKYVRADIVQPPVIEGLTALKKPSDWTPTSRREIHLANYGWNACIDYLASRGMIGEAQQPTEVESVKAQRALEVFNAMIEYGEHALECSFAEMLNNMPVKEAFVTIRAALVNASARAQMKEAENDS